MAEERVQKEPSKQQEEPSKQQEAVVCIRAHASIVRVRLRLREKAGEQRDRPPPHLYSLNFRHPSDGWSAPCAPQRCKREESTRVSAFLGPGECERRERERKEEGERKEKRKTGFASSFPPSLSLSLSFPPSQRSVRAACDSAHPSPPYAVGDQQRLRLQQRRGNVCVQSDAQSIAHPLSLLLRRQRLGCGRIPSVARLQEGRAAAACGAERQARGQMPSDRKGKEDLEG